MSFTDAVAARNADDAPDARMALEAALAEEMRRSDALNTIAATIARQRDLRGVVQAVVDGGVALTGAEFGAFFYSDPDDSGKGPTRWAVSGAPPEAFSGLALPRSTTLLDATVGGAAVRSDDITADPRYGVNPPYQGTPEGHPPVRSYLAVSVVSVSGERLGGLFFGHSAPGVFSPRLEGLLEGFAVQAAAALDNVRLSEAVKVDVDAAAFTRERLQFALSAGRLGSWELDVATRAYEASDLCKANYGRAPDVEFGFADLLASVHDDDRERMQAAMERAIQTGAEYDIEYRVQHPSGDIRWIHARGRAAKTADHGGARRMAGVSLDVTERKRSEERQKLLLNELNHRVKNTLATVQSIASQTMRTSPEPTVFRPAFEARILALSQTHNILTNQNWQAASLADILLAELAPLAGARDGGGARFVLDSEQDVMLNPKAAVAMGMVVHELATNAVKYGALSKASGRVTVRARATPSSSGLHLTVDWIESDGPRVTPPKRRGFGTRLLERGLVGELGGEVKLDYRPEGLSCRIRLPMQALEPIE